jgi:hypothetical protein
MHWRFASSLASPDPTLVDVSRAPLDFDKDLAVVYRDFIQQEESDALGTDLQVKLKRYVTP